MFRENKIKCISALIFLFIFLDIVLLVLVFNTITPYAITSYNNDIICYVKNEKEANKIINAANETIAKYELNKNSNKDKQQIISVSSNTKIKRCNSKDIVNISNNAVKDILKEYNNNNIAVSINTISTNIKKEKSKIVYKPSNNLLAGEQKIVQKGLDTTQENVVSCNFINGNKISQNLISSKPIEDGKDTIIEKGTLGLPDGEDYRSYSGNPICKDGNDIVKTASQYIGILPYVYGGKSLETGVDCSGFVMAIYKLYGVSLNYPLEKEGISVSYKDIQPGDILYFPGHFGIYAGNGKMIHAPRTGQYISESSIGSRKILDIRRIITN